eukprot:403357295
MGANACRCLDQKSDNPNVTPTIRHSKRLSKMRNTDRELSNHMSHHDSASTYSKGGRKYLPSTDLSLDTNMIVDGENYKLNMLEKSLLKNNPGFKEILEMENESSSKRDSTIKTVGNKHLQQQQLMSEEQRKQTYQSQRPSVMQASQRDSIVPIVDTTQFQHLQDLDDIPYNQYQNNNDSIEIERLKNEDNNTSIYNQSDTSMYRVVDDMNTTFQSDVQRIEGRQRDSVVSGFSDQTSTQMFRMGGGTNYSSSQMPIQNFGRMGNSGQSDFGDTTQGKILQVDNFEDDDEEDESNNFGDALFKKQNNGQQKNSLKFQNSSKLLNITNNNSFTKNQRPMDSRYSADQSGFIYNEQDLNGSLGNDESMLNFQAARVNQFEKRDTLQSDADFIHFKQNLNGGARISSDFNQFDQFQDQSMDQSMMIGNKRGMRMINQQKLNDVSLSDIGDGDSFLQQNRNNNIKSGSNMVNFQDFQNNNNNNNSFGDNQSDNDESFIAKRGKAIMINAVE